MKCPGQDSRFWKPGAIFEAKCPKCGQEVEFFKDDTTRLCKKCGHRFLNPETDFGCASYCQYAEQCLGSLSPELLAQKEDLLKDRVAIEMKRHFGQDFKRIGRATRVARYAEQIGKQEGANLGVVLMAAYLHQVSIAREILTRLSGQEKMIDEVCHIVSLLDGPQKEETPNFKTVHDASLLATLEDEHKEQDPSTEELQSRLKGMFLTQSGRDLAGKILLRA
jgi:hypothetical protein